jgi:hypothetical protein
MTAADSSEVDAGEVARDSAVDSEREVAVAVTPCVGAWSRRSANA